MIEIVTATETETETATETAKGTEIAIKTVTESRGKDRGVEAVRRVAGIGEKRTGTGTERGTGTGTERGTETGTGTGGDPAHLGMVNKCECCRWLYYN